MTQDTEFIPTKERIILDALSFEFSNLTFEILNLKKDKSSNFQQIANIEFTKNIILEEIKERKKNLELFEKITNHKDFTILDKDEILQNFDGETSDIITLKFHELLEYELHYEAIARGFINSEGEQDTNSGNTEFTELSIENVELFENGAEIKAPKGLIFTMISLLKN